MNRELSELGFTVSVVVPPLVVYEFAMR